MTSFRRRVYNAQKGDISGFAKACYKIVRKIPKGKVLAYKEIAKRIKNPRAWRAVGNALNKNRDSKIPCHRVIRSNGEVGGYRKGVKNKITLLKKEGLTIKEGKVI